MIGGLDIDESAVSTASYNLSWRFGNECSHLCSDVREISADVFHGVDRRVPLVVIGGPPCQAYSLIGRAKLRSLGIERTHTNDHRGFLFEDFLRLAEQLDADAVVMENVPESVDYGGRNIPEHVSGLLTSLGYNAKWTILNSADYGVPQLRERVFVVAVKKAIPIDFGFPIPTHSSAVPYTANFERRMEKFEDLKYFVQAPSSPDCASDWVTVEDAISDLPSLFPNSRSRYRLYKPSMRLPYRTPAQNEYQNSMRTWYGQDLSGVTGHSFRRNLRDFQIFECMHEGDDYTIASEIADRLLEESARANGINAVDNPDEYERLKQKIVPPYSRTKFLSKWKKLTRSRPSHTLTAHLGVDSYSHIHPWEPRGISVREAARLQSFPDEFLFFRSMNDAFRQIGNAVPPLLAKAIAEELMTIFTSRERGVAVNGQSS